MFQDKVRLSLLLLTLYSCRLSHGMWEKRYYENYHRPTYYNPHHKSGQHVDYNRQALEERDEVTTTVKTTTVFDFESDKSFYVHILHKASVIGAGALISRRLVITSARCFLGTKVNPTPLFQAKDMSVLSSIDFATPEKASAAIAFYLPQGRNNSNDVHDIALIALAAKLDKGDYNYIPLTRKVPKAKDEVKMVFRDSYTYDVTVYNTKVVDTERCQMLYEKTVHQNIAFDEEMFCVRNKKFSKKSVCSTRPGDPLIINNKLAAINIYGEHCEDFENDSMDVYISIKYTIKYLQRATDLLRAFTGTGPFNPSFTTRRTILLDANVTEQRALAF
ncbi:CG14061 [Drosophila busckii]|uniref:CG14061 n=1 Tax=Drosophila busckii TaxID=30019 RepID=A0A0M4F6B5_DROBS|nr:CG14061 [Drosophila busckii]